MVEDRPRYELHFYASVQGAVVRDDRKVTQIVQESFAQFTDDPLHQLPVDLPDFTGRQEELERLIRELAATTQQDAAAQDANSSRSAIAAIAGMAGVGKSTLAIHVAHQLKQNFPDAQLYINLRGTESQPLDPMDVLASFLRAWGIDDPLMPDDLTNRSKLYRSVVSDKRVLVVLDNAHDSAQIRPLLPDSSSCAVLVTSRKRLAALGDATTLDLAAMKESEAVELFQRLVGVERTLAQLDAANTIIDLCDRLPLAIRLAGGMLRNYPQWRLEDYMHQLNQERQSLEQLRLSNLDVRASFASSFKQLDEISARLFRLLGLLQAQSFAPAIAAALLELEPVTAEQFVKYLVDLQLLEPAREGRYRLHDLVRLFAKEQLAQEEPAEARQAARLRTARWYLEASEVMNLALKPETRHSLAQVLSKDKHQYGEVTEPQWLLAALNWFQLERMNLLASVEWAYQAQEWETVVALVKNLVNFFNIHIDRTNWERTHLLALEASRRLSHSPDGDSFTSRQQEAQTLTNLGNVYTLYNAWEKACECYEQSLIVFGELEDHLGIAKTTGNLATIYAQQGNWEKACEYYEQSRFIFSELGDSCGEAQTSINMGIFHLDQGHEEEAGVLWQEALKILSPELPQSQRLTTWLERIQELNSVSDKGDFPKEAASSSNVQASEEPNAKTSEPVRMNEELSPEVLEKVGVAKEPREQRQPLALTTEGEASQELNHHPPKPGNLLVFAAVIVVIAFILFVLL
jgi:tetratricopeptide (TPR) repeat protein